MTNDSQPGIEGNYFFGKLIKRYFAPALPNLYTQLPKWGAIFTDNYECGERVMAMKKGRESGKSPFPHAPNKNLIVVGIGTSAA